VNEDCHFAAADVDAKAGVDHPAHSRQQEQYEQCERRELAWPQLLTTLGKRWEISHKDTSSGQTHHAA
jgi:hypothetical protein